MGQVQIDSQRDEMQRYDVENEIDSSFLGRISTRSSVGALALAAMESVCLAVIAVAHTGVALGFFSVLAASGEHYWHSNRFRIPILVAASLVAVANLYTVRRKWTLRNAPSAAWRKRPVSRRERLRIGFVLASSIITLLLVFGEVWAHRRLGM